MRGTPRILISVVAALALVGGACGSDDDADSSATSEAAAETTATPDTTVPETVPETTTAPEPTAAPTTPAPTTAVPTTAPALTVAGDITVFAAASVTAAFEEIGAAFMVEYPDANVVFNFAASSELAAQIIEGAPADVFASADLGNMTKITDVAANGGEPVVFTKNLASIIVAPGNPKGITLVADLANEDLIYVQCAPEVPCGKYAAAIFENAGVTVTPKSLEENVKAVVTKVTLGEADAGIVYVTDVTAAGADAEGVEIPSDVNVVAEYPIATTAAAPNADGAQAFVDFVMGEQGQKILQSYGFIEL